MRLFQFLTLSALVIGTAACSGGNSTSDKKTDDSTQSTSTDSTSTTYTGKIAVLRMDSLMRGYGLYIDKSDEFGKKQQKIQNELTAKGRSLEREVMEYQEKAQKGLVTQYQSRIAEEGFQKKQQDIIAYRDRVMGELSQGEAIMSAEISEEIMTYINEYNKVKGYSMILQTQGGMPVMLVDPALDITAEVLVELNKRYEAKLNQKATTKK